MIVSRETIEQLTLYQKYLEQWQKKINLVSKATLPDVWKRHFEDSLQLLKYIPEQKLNLIDMGSGAGFPGLVLAMARPNQLCVTLVEADQRKSLFLENVSRETKTSVTLLNERIEKLKNIKADVITARALCPLNQLFEYAFHLLTEKSVCLFHKGKGVEKEIEEAKKNWNFELEIIPSITDSEGKIIKVTCLRRASSHD